MALALFTASSAADAQVGKIERIKTPAGIEVWFVRDDTLPILSVNFAFNGGASQDPADRAGLAYMTAALLDEGAGDLDAKAFQERLEGRAITLSFKADRDAFRGSVRVLSEHREEAFELLRLALTAPRFDQEAIDRIRASIIAANKRSLNNPDEVAGLRWFASAFPGHPYGRPVKGDENSIGGIERSMLFAYAKKNLARSNLKIAVVGSADSAEISRLVDHVFAKLPAKAELAAIPEAAPQALGTREVIDLNIPQTTIAFGGVGLKRRDPDFMSAFVLNHILGGSSFSSRLYREVREKRGLAYSVYSYLATLDRSGLFMGGTSTRNDRAGEALQIIEQEIVRIAKDGPTPEELTQAKSYLTGSYLLHFDTSAKVAAQLLEIQLEDLGIDYISRRNNMVNAVTANDVRRAAKKFLADSKLLVILVGRPAPLSKSNGG
ncbi:MAG: insulinase family protein [Rhizobiales bacterium]|nr:insulinase family protein [Hyphomicrobiales bacterium]